MEKKRLEELLNNILGWASEHDDEFMKCVVKASQMTIEEARELDVASYHEDREYEDLGLPTEARMDIDSCLADSIEDEEYVVEEINNFLSDTYGWCVWNYDYEVVGDEILITNIEWDLDD